VLLGAEQVVLLDDVVDGLLVQPVQRLRRLLAAATTTISSSSSLLGWGSGSGSRSLTLCCWRRRLIGRRYRQGAGGVGHRRLIIGRRGRQGAGNHRRLIGRRSPPAGRPLTLAGRRPRSSAAPGRHPQALPHRSRRSSC
jgi:hypothetical protein